MSRSPFRLTSTIGRNYSVDTDDVFQTKTLLNELGYFEPPAYGLTPYPDAPLFDGIEEFQDDFDLTPDGVMKPDGETVTKINEVLEYKNQVPKPNEPRTQPEIFSKPSRSRLKAEKERSGAQPQRGPASTQVAAAPAIPVIVYEIAIFFSMSVAAAYAWWISLSADQKKQVRPHIDNAQEQGTTDEAIDGPCERLYKIDIDTCRQISKNVANKRDRDAMLRPMRGMVRAWLENQRNNGPRWIHGTTRRRNISICLLRAQQGWNKTSIDRRHIRAGRERRGRLGLSSVLPFFAHETLFNLRRGS